MCLLILLFIRPAEQNDYSYNLVPFQTIFYYLSGEVNLLIATYNLVANIGLFIPYGVAFLLLKSTQEYSIVKRTIIPILSIIVIELLQFISRRGSLDIDDVILNVIGAIIGYRITPLIRRVVKII
ncbi:MULTISPECIES: VanZ family protein [Bacillus]|uniref:VanZ family protein n=1 Tax=Bacillus TaxID=1386 RepID=UPI001CA32B53|nr:MULTISPECIES: VanZ family protein [Bacillus]